MSGLLRILLAMFSVVIFSGGWLFACSGQEPRAQQQRQTDYWREATFYSPVLRQHLSGREAEKLFAGEQRILLYCEAGRLDETLERLKLQGYSVERVNVSFQQITLRVNSAEALHQLQEIEAITAVTLASRKQPIFQSRR